MVGKVLNPGSKPSRTSGADFNCGFCSVYPDSRPAQTTLLGSVDDYTDSAVYHVAKLRDLMRNGMYHLGYPKKNLLIHNSPKILTDFEVVQIRDQQDGETVIGIAYLMNPHLVTRTLVDHFARLIAVLRQTSNVQLRTKFEQFFDDFDAA
jgi:hypothetical protein